MNIQGILKIIATLFNIGFLVVFFVSFIQQEPKIKDMGDLMFLLLIFGMPIINLFWIYFLKDERSNWFGLFLKRKSLEEQLKIKEVKDKIESKKIVQN